jgi:hypothetical protein
MIGSISDDYGYDNADTELTSTAKPDWGWVELEFQVEDRRAEVQVTLTPDEARLLSLRLMRLADLVDPAPVD